MNPARLLAAVLFAGFVLGATSVDAQPIPRPPAVLSPDLTDPWLLQMAPGKRRPVISEPINRHPIAAFAPGTLAPKFPSAKTREIDPDFLPAIVDYPTSESAGTVVIDTEGRYLYLVLGNGKAKRYGVGVGRPGFEWAGTHRVTRKAEWPDWIPPEEMRQRQPYLPASMKGGPGNPLGARAMYLGSTLYRIHGSNEPWTIGHAVSSGCIRMRNEDVIDLYEQVKVGTRVIVM
jgi:lipoprotein-anchoring transpeptidase ErfK/SrfK